MKLIIGLGNPGEKYKLNRHNAGFLCIDHMVTWLNTTNHKITGRKVEHQAIMQSVLIHMFIDEVKLLFVKPQTFMNKSGDAVNKIMFYYNLTHKDILVIHDDLDIHLGSVKLQCGKGPKVHNGLTSINQMLGTENYMRLRVGIENRNNTQRIPGQGYVLSNFTSAEKEILNEACNKKFPDIKKWIISK